MEAASFRLSNRDEVLNILLLGHIRQFSWHIALDLDPGTEVVCITWWVDSFQLLLLHAPELLDVIECPRRIARYNV